MGISCARSNHLGRCPALLSASALTALALATCWPADAQAQQSSDAADTPVLASSTEATTSQPAEDDGTIVVTGSRVATDGTKAPTPVTVVSTEQLQFAAPTTVTEALLQLPAFAGSASVANQSTGTTGSNGAAHLNLRGLGTSRTLVLLDGRRVVAASSAGSVDVALLPEALVQRIEVVTGGASAAYGSDAVGGVVNYILDTKFSGIKGSIQAGVSERGDYQNYKVALAAGQSFMDDRLSVIASIEHYYNGGVKEANQRDWAYRGRGVINNPAVTAANPASPTNPKRLVVVNPLASNASYGGLIINTALAGTTFDPGGIPRAFQYGPLRTAATMAGSTDPTAYNPNLQLTLQPAQERTAAFGHAHFDVTDNFGVFVEANLAQNKVFYQSLPTFELSQTAFTIFNDNAFLPASVRQDMLAGNIASVTVGRVSPDIAIPTLDGESNTRRFAVGFDGEIGDSWTYNGYYQAGRNRSIFKTINDPISNNLYRAADAVVDPATGNIVCRSTLTTPSDACVPLNIFGAGSPSQAAIAYVTGTAVQDVTVKQKVAEVSIQGEVIELPGGPLGVAMGAGYRKEEFVQVVDPISSSIRTGIGIGGFPAGLVNTLGGFERTNPQPSAGSYDVKEVFGEANLPLLADIPLAHALTLNAAVRYTNYSTSGGVVTWKVGAVYEPIEGLRFRGTRSRDIRAPSLGELYRGSSQGTSTVTDPTRGGEQRNALTGAVGNPNLTPEIADTMVLGVVVQPRFLEGFSASVDYYDIKIKDALSALGAQRTVDLCAAGATELCAFVQRDPEGRISRVELPFFNVDLRSVEGIDFEASYRVPLGGAELSLRMLANYLISFTTQVPGAEAVDDAGEIGRLKGILSANLDLGRTSIFVQERYVGGGKFDTQLTPTDIDLNHEDAVLYTDATINFDLTEDEGARFFLSVNNLFDKDPPLTPSYLIAGSSFGDRTLYDLIGRRFTAGFRFKM